MTSKPKEPAKLTQPERVQTELRKIPFSAIVLDPESYAFREPEDLEDHALQPLAEDIGKVGLTTPFLVSELAGGLYRGLDCHRRHGAIDLNIRRGVAGFTPDMELPANVILGDASERALVTMSIAGNVQRLGFSDLGRVRAATRLHQLAVPREEIGRCLGASKTTVGRWILLGTDQEMMAFVKDRSIYATDGITLLKAANDANRLFEFKQMFARWVEQKQRELDEEDARRRADDESSLTLNEWEVRKHLSSRQVSAWVEQLKTGQPLGEPTFRFVATIRSEGGKDRLTMQAISAYLDDLPVNDLGKVTARTKNVSVALERTLRKRVQMERAVKQSQTVVEEADPGQELLKELGLDGNLAASDRPSEDEADEPGDDSGEVTESEQDDEDSLSPQNPMTLDDAVGGWPHQAGGGSQA